jgi:recombination protein RecA
MKLAPSSGSKDKPVKRTVVEKKSNTVASDKVSALSKLMADVSKKHGDGSLMKMGESPIKDVGVISSGSIGIDYAFGIGGYPRGRIVEVFGPEASGKTTLTLHAIAECQRDGGVAAFIDAEHALDLAYARNLGINVDDLLFSQPDYGEQALNIVEDIVRADVVDLVVVDSVAALTPKAEIEADMEKNHIGLQARMMSQALRKLTAIVGKTNTCLMFINQTRQKIGVMFGDPTTTPGGTALKFYCSVRAQINRVKSIKDGDEIVGNTVRVKVVKNKMAPPFKQCVTDIVFGKGINRLGEIVDMSLERDIIEKAGAWYKYEGNNIGQGRNAAVEFLRNNDDIREIIEERLLKELHKTT